MQNSLLLRIKMESTEEKLRKSSALALFILNHIPDLVEKVEDENMDSFTKLKEGLDSLRMSVQQQKNGGGIIIERDTSGDRPSCTENRFNHGVIK